MGPYLALTIRNMKLTRHLAGVFPELVCPKCNTSWMAFIELRQGTKERLRFRFKPEQAQRTQDAGQAKVIVMARSEPVGRTHGKVLCELYFLRAKFQSVKTQHAHEGLPQSTLQLL